jgi:hypothetical protein
MKKTPFRKSELAIPLLRTLSEVLDVRSHLVRSEILGSERSLLPRLGPVHEGRLRPVLIPVCSRRPRA